MGKGRLYNIEGAKAREASTTFMNHSSDRSGTESRRTGSKSTLVRADELLVTRGLAESRSRAQQLLMAGQVLFDELLVDKAGKLVSQDSKVEVKSRLQYVSRGGLKLAAALEAFEVDPADRICADFGASTGGFTDCLLQHGAARVYAIDVGYGQLAWSLRADPRVVVMERVNARLLESLPEAIELATIDVSFIGLRLILPRVGDLLLPAGQVIALIKPQFEVGRESVGKGGVVRDPSLHRAAIEQVLTAACENGFLPAGLIQSPVRGPAGNVEFLAWLRHAVEPQRVDSAELKAAIDAWLS
jgi:23S rRNA (cytidine1920-2'-O)/16S rRNA (cytidine1409-2'-O)-methyltransferase